jgi:hypothetical protein
MASLQLFNICDGYVDSTDRCMAELTGWFFNMWSPLWAIVCRDDQYQIMAALLPTSNAIAGKADIGNLMAANFGRT